MPAEALTNENVRGLDVAVDDPVPVAVRQSGPRVGDDPQDAPGVQRHWACSRGRPGGLQEGPHVGGHIGERGADQLGEDPEARPVRPSDRADPDEPRDGGVSGEA